MVSLGLNLLVLIWFCRNSHSFKFSDKQEMSKLNKKEVYNEIYFNRNTLYLFSKNLEHDLRI